MSIGDLEPGVIPIFLVDQLFQISMPSARQRLKPTPTTTHGIIRTYRLPISSQGQTIPRVIVEIGAVPYGKLTPLNVCVALTRSSGRKIIHLVRDFDDSLFTMCSVGRGKQMTCEIGSWNSINMICHNTQTWNPQDPLTILQTLVSYRSK